MLDREDEEVYVLGAAGEYAKFINQPVFTLKNLEIEENISGAYVLKSTFLSQLLCAVYQPRWF